MAHGAGHAVDEGLGPDHQHVGTLAGLGGHVLAAAEADLQPDFLGLGHQVARLERRGRHGDLGQQGVEQGLLARLHRPRLQAAERAQRPVGLLGIGHGRGLSL
jgi:hypothetical protein